MVGTVTVTVSETGVTVSYILTAKGASLKAGALAFLPAGDDLIGLAPEDVQETAIDPNAAFSYALSLDLIPQSGGVALLTLPRRILPQIARKSAKHPSEAPKSHNEL